MKNFEIFWKISLCVFIALIISGIATKIPIFLADITNSNYCLLIWFITFPLGCELISLISYHILFKNKEHKIFDVTYN